MTIAAIEQALLTQLKGEITDLAVEAFPDDPRSYQLLHTKGAVLVHYEGSLPERPVRKGTVLQREEVRFGLTVVMRNLRSTDAGAYSAIDRVRAAVLGCKLAGCGRAWINKTELLDAENGLWSYTIGVSMLHVLVVANANVPDTSATTLSASHRFTDGYEFVNLTSLGSTDWLAVTGWYHGEEREHKALAAGVDRSISELRAVIDPVGFVGTTLLWGGTTPKEWSDGTFNETGSGNMAAGIFCCTWDAFDEFAGEFQLAVNATVAAQRLVLCLPNKNCSYKVEFTLPGADPVVIPVGPGTENGNDSIFTVDFSAAAAGKQLRVRVYAMMFNVAYDSPLGFRFAALSPVP